MADGYGPGTNGPLEVVLDTDGAPRSPTRPSHDVATALADEPGVASVDEPVTNEARGHRDHQRHADDVAAGRARPASCSQHLRRTRLPGALDGTDVEASVTGGDRADRRRLVPAAAADAAGSSEPSSVCRSWC